MDLTKTIKSLTNEELLDQYRFFAGWESDDYCLTDMEPSDRLRMDRIEKEILKRMNTNVNKQ